MQVTVSGEGAGEVPTDERHLVVRAMLRGVADLGGGGTRGSDGSSASTPSRTVEGWGSSATAIVTGVGAAYG